MWLIKRIVCDVLCGVCGVVWRVCGGFAVGKGWGSIYETYRQRVELKKGV